MPLPIARASTRSRPLLHTTRSDLHFSRLITGLGHSCFHLSKLAIRMKTKKKAKVLEEESGK